MKTQKLIALSALLMMLMIIGACGDKDKSLDMEGLKLGKSLTSMLGEATTLLGGITDLESAKAALPKLTEMDSGLGDLVAKAKKLSPESLDSFKGMALKAVPSLEGAVAKLTEIPGVGETVKPIVDSMMAKIKSL